MVDVTDATFEQAVLDRSAEVPVVVDLWAEWCGPCRTLGPIIERVVAATDGAVELVKVDVDTNPRISATFNVQSIPAVFAHKDRRIVDSFIGALPEAEVKKFVDKLAPPLSDADRLVLAGDEASLRQALELDHDHPGAVIALADLLIDGGVVDEALELLKRLPETAEVRRVAARARLAAVSAAAASAGGDGGAGEVDIDARFESLLGRVKDDESARQEFLDMLELLGADDPRRTQYRRALASRLY